MTGDVSIVIDKETGCKYLKERIRGQTYSNGLALTILLKADGMPDCEPEQEQQ